jgi:hypothetical protein
MGDHGRTGLRMNRAFRAQLSFVHDNLGWLPQALMRERLWRLIDQLAERGQYASKASGNLPLRTRLVLRGEDDSRRRLET